MNAFVYYDQRHCEATDIRQRPDAIDILTFDEKMPSRTLFQGTLRMRQFHDGQLILPMVSAAAQTQIPKGDTLQGLLRQTLISQAKSKAEETYRSYRQKMTHQARQGALETMLETDDFKQWIKLYTQSRDLFITEQTISPYKQFGSRKEKKATKPLLKEEIETFSKAHPEAASALHELIEDVKASSYLPKEVLMGSTIGGALGNEIHTERQLEVALSQETELEISLDIQRELQNYLGSADREIYYENPWTKDSATTLLNMGAPLESLGIHSLSSWLQSNAVTYEYPYHQIFDDTLTASKNWAHTFNRLQPVFSEHQKPAHQILAIKSYGKVKLILLSIAEASFFKSYLEKHQPKNLWLIHPDGREISNHSHTLPEKQQYERAIFQVQFFNGNASYLNRYDKLTKAFFSEGHSELKWRYLQLKTATNPEQRNILNKYLSKQMPDEKKESDRIQKPQPSIAQRVMRIIDYSMF
jgi:hypothetical protein